MNSVKTLPMTAW